MAHDPDAVVLVLKRVDRSKYFMLTAIAALFFAVLLTFAFLMAHVRDSSGSGKLLFAAAGAEMAFIAGCAVLVSLHVTRMTRAVLNAIELSRK